MLLYFIPVTYTHASDCSQFPPQLRLKEAALGAVPNTCVTL